MKLGLFLLSILIIFGCQENTSLLEPTNEIKSESFNNDELTEFAEYDEKSIFSEETDSPAKFDDSYDLPDIGAFKSKTKMTKSFTVDGSKGGKLRIKHGWRDGKGRKVKLSATLTIPKNAYEGELTFDMIFDLENYAMELYPSPFTFDIPVILDLKFSGVDLSNLDTDLLDFDYLDGAKEYLKYKKIKIDEKKGVLEIIGAEIPHFSRYGWSRKR